MARMRPLTLRFDSDELESSWRAQRARESLRPFRAATSLAIVLYVAFIVLDRALLEDVAGRLLVVRALVCVLLLAMFALTWTPAWRRHHASIEAGAVLVAGGGIVTMLAVGSDEAGLYWAGLMLVLMAIHGLFRPRLPISVTLSVALVVAFNAIVIPAGIIPLATVVADDFFLVSAAILGTLGTYSLERLSRAHYLATEHLEEERRLRERLLLNILPEPIARRLMAGEEPIADQHDDVTVLFADIVGFTAMTAGMRPDELVRLLDRVFHEFEIVARDHEIQKVKTVGDACMMVAGLSGTRRDHAARVAEAALAMRERIAECRTPDGEPLRLHIGIASGPVVAGVIGRTRFSYDLWGDVVNTASRMASLGERDRIQVHRGGRPSARGPLHVPPARPPRGEREGHHGDVVPGAARVPCRACGSGGRTGLAGRILPLGEDPPQSLRRTRWSRPWNGRAPRSARSDSSRSPYCFRLRRARRSRTRWSRSMPA